MADVNILFLGSQMMVGGAQRVLFDQARWFHEKGYKVIAAFLYDKYGFANEWSATHPFPVVDLGAASPKDRRVRAVRLFGAMIKLARLLRTEHVTVIETFTPHANLIGLPLAWLAGVPRRVASYHGPVDGFPRILKKLHALIINTGMASGLVTISDYLCELAEAEGVSPCRIQTIHNGIDFVPASSDARQVIRAALGVNAESPLILSVGRLTEQKAHSVLVRAAQKVRDRFPAARFVIVGDGPLRAALEGEMGQLDLQGTVMLVGGRENIPDYIAAADLFVLPSREEGLGVALLEAMSGGLASVATRVGGIPEIIRDGENGLLVPPDDPDSLTDAIVRLLSDPAECVRLRGAGKSTVENGFTVNRMCEQYLQIFLAEPA